MNAVVEIAAHQLDYKEINHITVNVETGAGGKYQLQFKHVDGPKIDLCSLRETAAKVLSDSEVKP